MNIEHELIDITAENLEVAIDLLLENDIAREIPFLNSVLALLRSAKNIRDRLFVQKLQRFIEDVNSVDDEAQKRLFEKMASDPEEARRVGETTLAILERAISTEKAEIIAKIFVAYGLGHLRETDFRRLCEAIDRSFADDLMKLVKLHKVPDKSKEEFLAFLLPSGFTISVGGNLLGDLDSGQIYYKVTSLGNKFRTAYYVGIKHIGE